MRARPGFIGSLGLAAVVASAACSNPETPHLSQPPASITLSAQQAAILEARMQSLATTNTDLAWLADSVSFIVRGGAEAKHIVVGIDGKWVDFWAVSLERDLTAEQFSMFHVFAFDDATNPTSFVVLSGYFPRPGTPEVDFTGSYGTVSAHANIILGGPAGSDDLIASAGTMTVTRELVNVGSCGTIDLPADVACQPNRVRVSTSITAASEVGSPQTHTASLSDVSIPGLIITYQ